MLQAEIMSVKISVCIVTYNQEKYIRQCLQSIVDQETDFEFEVIVGDDCSTDGTREIVREFANKYPIVIKPIFHDKNIGPTQNYFSVHNSAKGEYVAHIDGDDYALPGKLKALAGHLDKHQDCAIVWHQMIIINEKGQSAIGMPIVPIANIIGKEKLYANDIALYYGITGCHSGSMYRYSCKRITYHNSELLDYYFTLSMCMDGHCAMYIYQPYGAYRFYSTEQTITRAKGNHIVGRGKLTLMKDFIRSHPQLKKFFAAQCIFEIMLRSYFRAPLVTDFVAMWIKCGMYFNISNILTIWKVFMANRNTKLRKAFKN